VIVCRNIFWSFLFRNESGRAACNVGEVKLQARLRIPIADNWLFSSASNFMLEKMCSFSKVIGTLHRCLCPCGHGLEASRGLKCFPERRYPDNVGVIIPTRGQSSHLRAKFTPGGQVHTWWPSSHLHRGKLMLLKTGLWSQVAYKIKY
jgi:hypothetical protein